MCFESACLARRVVLVAALAWAAGCDGAGGGSDAACDGREELVDSGDEAVDSGRDADLDDDGGGDAGDDAAAGGEDGGPVGVVGIEGLRSSGGFLRDALGRAVILRGALWPDLAWAWGAEEPPAFTAADAERLRGWGFDHVRIFFRWQYLEPAPGELSEEYVDAIEAAVSTAEEHGLYVVLELDQADWAPCFPRESERCESAGDCRGDRECVDHLCSPLLRFGHGIPDWLCEGYANTFAGKYEAIADFWTGAADPIDPAIQMKDRLTEIWVRLGERLADHGGLGYALMNEPPAGALDTTTFEDDWLYPYWTLLAAAIRAVDPDAIFFYSPYWALRTAAAGGPIAVPNRVYSPHFYPGLTFACGEFPPGADVEAELQQAVDPGRARGEATWVGEWGACAGSPEGAAAAGEYAELVTQAFDGRMVSHSIFVYAADDFFGLLRQDGSENAEVLRAMDRTYPQAIAGTPLAFAFDVPSCMFMLVFLQEPWIDGDTVIYVPERHYPDGFDVLGTDVDGNWSWRWDAPSRELRVRADPRASVHAIVVRPSGGVLADECSTAADCDGTGCHRLEPFGVDLCADDCTEDDDCPDGQSCAGAKMAELFGVPGYCVQPCARDDDCLPDGSRVRLGAMQMCRGPRSDEQRSCRTRATGRARAHEFRSGLG